MKIKTQVGFNNALHHYKYSPDHSLEIHTIQKESLQNGYHTSKTIKDTDFYVNPEELDENDAEAYAKRHHQFVEEAQAKGYIGL